MYWGIQKNNYYSGVQLCISFLGGGILSMMMKGGFLDIFFRSFLSILPDHHEKALVTLCVVWSIIVFIPPHVPTYNNLLLSTHLTVMGRCNFNKYVHLCSELGASLQLSARAQWGTHAEGYDDEKEGGKYASPGQQN